MKVLVSDLIGTPGAHREDEVSLEVSAVMDAARLEGPVTGSVRYDAGVRDIMASGRMEYLARAICIRCLIEFDYPGKATFSQLYAENPQSEDVMQVHEHGVIDIEPPIRDEVVLSLPLSPVCRPDCAGLCSTCGTDLNREPCEGHDDVSSSPFAILAQLLDPEDL